MNSNTLNHNKSKLSSLCSRTKKSFVVVGVVVILIVVISLSIFACMCWYNNPNKMMADGFAGLLSSTGFNGDINLKNNSASTFMSVDFVREKDFGRSKIKVSRLSNGKSSVPNKEAKIGLDLITNFNGSLYIKADDIDKITNTLSSSYIKKLSIEDTVDEVNNNFNKDQLKEKVENYFSRVANKLRGKWIKINYGMLSRNDVSRQVLQCIDDLNNKIRNDKSTSSILVKNFRKNQFILVDENQNISDKSGSKGLRIKFDKVKADNFMHSIRDLDIVNESSSCNKFFKLFESKKDRQKQEPSNNFTIWVNRISHKITHIELQSKDNKKRGFSYDFNIKLSYGDKIEPRFPNNTETVDIRNIYNILQN